MSSTITETERRTVPTMPEISAVKILKKRDNFTRSGSIEKLKKFNSFICSQHYYILPSLLLWLKTSRTILTSNVEKCMVYLRSMFLISTIYQCFQLKDNRIGAFFKLNSRDINSVVSVLLIKTNERLVSTFEDIKKAVLVFTIYLGVTLIILQMFLVIGLLFFKMPPLGFVFLICCVLYMSRIAAIVMMTKNEDNKTKDNGENTTVEERRIVRKRLSFIGKTLSNIKLF